MFRGQLQTDWQYNETIPIARDIAVVKKSKQAEITRARSNNFTRDERDVEKILSANIERSISITEKRVTAIMLMKIK